MRLNLKNKVFINSYLAVALAFFFPLAAATSAFATQTPAQQVAQLQQDFNYYTQRYSTYVGHYQQYAPNRMSELNAFASSLTTFSSAVATAQTALTASNTATQELATAQSNVSAVPGLISTSQQALNVAQQNYDVASDSLQALTPSYSQALQERNDAYSAYQATVVNQNIFEDFNGGQITSGIQFLLDGASPIQLNTGNPQLQYGRIFVNQYPQTLQVKPPTGATPTALGFETYARNGDQTITVTFTDNTTATFINPNGVGNPNCPNYYCNVSYTAPAGKIIQSYVIPGDYDILYLDKFTFANNSYNPAAYATYQEKQSALDALAPAYNAASATLASASQTLASAQALYNTYSNPTYLSNLESIRDGKEEAASTASTALATAINDAIVARQATIDAYSAIVLPPTSLEVTSTVDSATAATEVGTLRWAITQANATAGGIYDLITIKTTQPIVLASNLPLITQNVTITSDNRATSIIDGAGLYSAFDQRNSSITTQISNLTIQNTYASDWQKGSALWVVRGTANVNNVHFKNISQGTAVTTKEGGSYINITNSLFSNNNRGVFSNYGGTPSTTTEADTQYDNRITINNTTFNSNVEAIYGERTVLVDNSQFLNNGYGFRMQGINKHRVTNSLFDGNTYAIYTNAWVPTTWTTFYAAPNRVIQNNVFKNTTGNKVIILDDYANDGKADQRGASITGNSWDGEGGIFVEYNHFDRTNNVNNYYQILSVDDIATHPFTFSNNIDIAPRIDTPTNVQAVVNQDGSVTVTWTAPQAYNTTIERYTIAWSDTTFTSTGWAWNHTLTTLTIPANIFEETSGVGENIQFRVRADNDTTQVYSQYTPSVEIELPAIESTNTPTPTPTSTQEPQPTTSPEAPQTTPTPEPSATEQPSPSPSPQPIPSPEPTSTPITPDPTPTTQPEPEPQPTQTPEQTEAPQPEPEETSTPEPTPSPSSEPEPEPEPSEPSPTPEPSPEETPVVEPQPEPSRPEDSNSENQQSPEEEPQTSPSPQPQPEPSEPEESVEIKEEVSSENIIALTEELANIEPTELTEEQAEQIKEAALEVFESAEQGSPEYEAALDALLVVAQQDDIVVDEQLAEVPVVGAAVVALVDAFNALGNAGADMSPQVREQSEKVVIAAVIVGQIAMTATAAATSAAASAGRRP